MNIISSMLKSKYGVLAALITWPSVAEMCFTHIEVNLQRSADDHIQLAKIRERTIPPPATKVIAVTNVQVFDGETISGPSTVIINGEHIGRVVPFGNMSVPGAEIVDGEGGILLPGLIDNHCHPGNLDDLTTLTSYGVTTAMGMACLSYDLCNALLNQTGLSSFITTGIAAIAPGSPHATLFDTPLEDTIASPDQAPEFVANVFGNHSTFLKMVAEDNGPSQETLNALVSYTHKAGRVATTHASSIEAYNQAITSMTDSIQHVPVDAPLNASMAEQILQQNQFVTPTLNAYKYLLELDVGAPSRNLSNGVQSARTLHEAGVPLLVGTDSFVDHENGMINIPFGNSLHAELELLVQAGMEPLDVLRGATSLAAKLHSLPDRGSITTGLRADLLLIQGNPLTNISNTRNIKRVWVGGHEYDGSVGE